MTQRIITDQAVILALLLDLGLDGKIKPRNPNSPGVLGLCPALGTDMQGVGNYYIIDRCGDYIVTVLEGASLLEACAVYTEYGKRKRTEGAPHLHVVPLTK